MNIRKFFGITCVVYGVAMAVFALDSYMESRRLNREFEAWSKNYQKTMKDIVEKEQERQKQLDSMTADFVKQLEENGHATVDGEWVKKMYELKWGWMFN